MTDCMTIVQHQIAAGYAAMVLMFVSGLILGWAWGRNNREGIR
jgi:hypothetical protein